jgi:hypothetical protein
MGGQRRASFHPWRVDYHRPAMPGDLICRGRVIRFKHRRSRSVTHESGHFHQICRRDHP